VETTALKQVKQELAIREYIGDDKEKAELMAKARENLRKVVARSLAEVQTTQSS
jgi:hypothetical protein